MGGREKFGIVRRGRQGDHAVDKGLSVERSHLKVASGLLESQSVFLVASAEIVDAGGLESATVGTGPQRKIQGSPGDIGCSCVIDFGQRLAWRLKIAIFDVAVAGGTGAALRACQLGVSAEWKMPDFAKYWFEDAAAPEEAGNGCRETGNSMGIAGAAQGFGGLDVGETDTGYS